MHRYTSENILRRLRRRYKMTGSRVVVKVDSLTKTFKIPTEASSGIKQKLVNTLKGKRGYREFTPLKSVSFEIEEGDFFGIVGRNGSGKSTLLKTIANIYTPTSGSVGVNGTLVPFIELGVGFNPELTGRENVFLNGALLGFSRSEIENMYDEIVEFSEIGDFMDEKLKNYSSGMQVRLAFSIAIKAEGDILLLDEVLAVGDEAFQKKCFEYFEKLKQDKKTVILVTHDMSSVKRFCTKAILIENGSIKVQGSPDDIANQYTLDNLATDDKKSGSSISMTLSDPVTSLKIKPKVKHVLSRDDVLEFEVEYEHVNTSEKMYVGISILYNGVPIIEHGTIDAEPEYDDGKRVSYTYRLPLQRFTQGDFSVSAAVINEKTKSPIAFTTREGNFHFGIRNKGRQYGGILIERGEWS